MGKTLNVFLVMLGLMLALCVGLPACGDDDDNDDTGEDTDTGSDTGTDTVEPDAGPDSGGGGQAGEACTAISTFTLSVTGICRAAGSAECTSGFTSGLPTILAMADDCDKGAGLECCIADNQCEVVGEQAAGLGYTSSCIATATDCPANDFGFGAFQVGCPTATPYCCVEAIPTDGGTGDGGAMDGGK